MHEADDDGNGYVDTEHVSITDQSADTWPRSVSQHLSQDEVLIVVQMLILQHAMMLVPVSWRILLQNIVLHTDTAQLGNERRG